MYTKFLTQEMLDECSRALGRPLMSNEVVILDRLLQKEQERRGAKVLSKDELTMSFLRSVKRV
jgi:hypothetical protein